MSHQCLSDGTTNREPQPAGALDRLQVLRESLREVRDAAEAAGQVAIAHRLACMVTDLHATISAVRQLTPAAPALDLTRRISSRDGMDAGVRDSVDRRNVRYGATLTE